jgi:centromere protein X
MPPKPFKPPRPSTSSIRKTPKPKGPSTSTTKKSTTKSTSRASGSSAFSLPALDSDSEVDPFASQDARTQGPEEEEEEEEDAADVTVIPDEDDERRESIPPELLTRLLHEFFTHDNTRMSKDAGKAVGRYMETFVREAMARAAFMRAESDAQTGGAGDGFLEVCYPFAQMVLGLLEDS